MTGPLRNWAGNIELTPRELARPRSVDELQELVAGSRRIRALGTGHSFNRIADSPGVLVSTAALPHVVEVAADRSTVTVSGGMRYGEVAALLAIEGLALHNMASLPHIGVAGACSTGTHGSGDANGNLATAVVAVELVSSSGEVVRLSQAADEGRFLGAVVGLGALGVVTRLTLDVQPSYEVAQVVYEGLPLHTLYDRFDEVMSSAYSVSLFTDWQGDRVDQVWRKQRLATGAAPPAEPVWMGARLATSPRHPLPGLPGDICTEQLGIPGPWNERLPHFRLDFTPSHGEELQSEYLLPRDQAVPAMRAVAALRGFLAPVLQVSEVRTVAADNLWLSPSHGRDTVAIHFTWVKDTTAVQPVVRLVEAVLGPLGARPHWGKVFDLAPDAIREQYPRWADFEALVAELDPVGRFRNDWFDRLFPPG